MIKKLLEWLLSFFQTGKEKELNEEIKKIDKKLEEVKNEKLDNDNLADYFNE